jgi:hypothetical protein
MGHFYYCDEAELSAERQSLLFDNGATLLEALCQTKSAHPPGMRGSSTVLRGYFTVINKAISKNNNMLFLMHIKPVVFITGKL